MLRDMLSVLSPESAHRAAIIAARPLKFLPHPLFDPRLLVEAFGLSFPNPVGLAAGFDKSAEAVEGLARIGFGFVEVGTVTPRPQDGNPKPRLFRLEADGAIVNRMGFNNEGYDRVHSRLLDATRRGIVGVNIGPNKDSTDRISDYVLGLKTFGKVVDYFAINISSPNTPGLRDLHAQGELERLLRSIHSTREFMSPYRPVLLKISPDLDKETLNGVLTLALTYKIDGLIVANTTVDRLPSLRSNSSIETGGLSGRPLFAPSTRMVAQCFLKCEGRIPIVGVGGIDSVDSAIEKFEAGARLIQIYTGLIYQGPSLIKKITNGLTSRIFSRKINSITDLIGVRAEQFSIN